nr:hypothetical protein [Arachnia propionica]
MGDRRSVPGPTLAVKPGEVTLYRFPNHIPLCWNATWRTDCRTVTYKQRRRQHGPAETVFPVESGCTAGGRARTGNPNVRADG